jgi:hypothetical protein
MNFPPRPQRIKFLTAEQVKNRIARLKELQNIPHWSTHKFVEGNCRTTE